MQRYPTFKTSCISSLFGLFARKQFPSWIQTIINRCYVMMMHVDLSEFEEASSYKSLNQLFTRRFKTRRLININEQAMISPCDGCISAYGLIENDTLLQIKGHTYRASALLSDYIAKNDKKRIDQGTFITIYLSPKDYHRYHAPLDMQILKAVHIPGKLYPVNLTWLKKIDGLFLENERVVLECCTPNKKRFYMVFVGALNVGKMVFHFDSTIQTNATSHLQSYYTYTDLHVKKGEELGYFEMGSTIVMLFEKDFLDYDLRHIREVKFGQSIGTLNGYNEYLNA